MQMRNQKIIDAIIEKANRDCPGSLAMIGIYGSFCTGDIYDKSDLDLMILINDENGYSLSHCFLLEDEYIGYDLYCTTWEALENDAQFLHPHISKLMDSKIVYCANDSYLVRLNDLKAKAASANTRNSAKNLLQTAEQIFAKAIISTELAEVRYHAVGMILNCLDAIALLNGRYYHLGGRRVFEEIGKMKIAPENLHTLVDTIAKATTVADLKASLVPLLQAVETLFEEPLPAPEVYPGTCEEMISNWRNKMYLAADTNDTWLALNCMASLDAMLKELGFHWNILDQFQPEDLAASARVYDEIITQYRAEYDKAGVPFQGYTDVDAFVKEYTKKKA